ncbi:hypothetical protein I41_36470 [Lacipirellula limnantheis]|uniref:Carboxypeptidase regulatory-like domain-containing protein n=1 Tax=Lacipirellula limnantheis TaxID=2528024 RepID=A0A517U1G1_9BACT|nr:hypothetical protein I41_36470 [Lacipirellula limnantheis]
MGRSRGACWLLLTIVASLSGCGGSGEPKLEGAVTYNGEPVASGSLSFMPVAGGTPFGAKVVDGRYVADKPSTGKFKVMVSGNRITTVPKTREEADALARQNQGRSLPANYIPEDAAGNAQEVNVSGGGETLDFAITGPPRE